jgi:hypothetical protein
VLVAFLCCQFFVIGRDFRSTLSSRRSSLVLLIGRDPYSSVIGPGFMSFVVACSVIGPFSAFLLSVVVYVLLRSSVIILFF